MRTARSLAWNTPIMDLAILWAKIRILQTNPKDLTTKPVLLVISQLHNLSENLNRLNLII